MREGPSRRTRAGAVTPSSSSTPSGQLRERLVGRFAFDLGLVDLLDLVAGMREPVREVAVVREQKRAGRVRVEPADRDDSRLVLDESDDGRAAVRIARRRHDAARLVKKNICDSLRHKQASVEVDDIARLLRMCSARRVTPLTRTRPRLISSSAPRREATRCGRGTRSAASRKFRSWHAPVTHVCAFPDYDRIGEEVGGTGIKRADARRAEGAC